VSLQEMLDRWREAGIITGSQADAIRAFESSSAAPLPAPAPPGPAPVEEAAPVEPARPMPPRPEPPARGRRSFGIGGLVPELDLRTFGTVLAGLALIALLANMFAVTTDLFLGPGQQVATEVEDVLHLVASVLGLIGGLRLASGRISGRELTYWSLGINLVATVLLASSRLRQPTTIGAIVFWIALAILAWRASYRGRYRAIP
jgi:hypothetical protein